MPDSTKKITKYILFTGLPGSGKSSTLNALIKFTQAEGKKVIYRDTEVKKYKWWYFYFAMFKYIPLWSFVKIMYFWVTYAPPANSEYKMFEYRFWQKKVALCKRVITGLVLIEKENPDYFIDETIEAEYRIFDFANSASACPWMFYSGTNNYLIVMHTPNAISMQRAVARESTGHAEPVSVAAQWKKKEPWFRDMHSRILKLSKYLSKNSIVSFQVRSVDGIAPIDDNVALLRRYLMVDY